MSDFGTPPPPPGYGAQMASPTSYASWGLRAGAAIIDTLALIPFYILAGIGMGIGDGFGMLLVAIGYLGAIGFAIWNVVIKQGSTGQTIGKGVLKIRLVGEQTGQPIGAGMSFVRQLVHILDAIPCYVGFLWPLWDAKRQTFADKVLSTAVVPA